MPATAPKTPPESLVVVVAIGFELSESFVDEITRLGHAVEFVDAPYVESEELRSARGRHGGQNPDGLSVPDIDAEARAGWARADIAVAMDLPDDLATLAPKLRWIQSITAGVDKYDLPALAAADIRLTNASGLGAAGIAEFVMARVLQHAKHLRVFDEQQTRHEWTGRFGTELTGRTIGIAGLGSIGRCVAGLARAFGMRVLATRASAKAGDVDLDVEKLFPAADLDAMLDRCDVVVSSLPSNDSTIGLFDADRFAAMPSGTFFCNVGRGAHVVESDLIAALESGHLGGAALDVTAVEPLPADDPLWDAPNIYISPHSSVSLDRYAQNLERLMIENLVLFVAGESMTNEITTGAT